MGGQSGLPEQMPSDTRLLVTYEGKCWWNITMYLMHLTIQIRDPATKQLLATGISKRSSLARKSAEGMVREVLEALVEETAGTVPTSE